MMAFYDLKREEQSKCSLRKKNNVEFMVKTFLVTYIIVKPYRGDDYYDNSTVVCYIL